ncbi:hypothetical protein EJ063_07585 [Vibrio aquaticus]|uniref:VspD n=1 Tax=Vibrio aquaticus TaxID=2496559 RepID=A0A432CYV0_9VIBR|nr:type III secretion system translocon subunit SctE [Vibrio aquaticus]RTZ16646.1 hypothetical protein EJ063_07585 [Vibrio aquaticus]
MQIYSAPTITPFDIGDDTSANKLADTDVSSFVQSPTQPLPGSSVELTELWRIVKAQMQLVVQSMSGTSADNNETKKTMIEVQRDNKIQELDKRMEDMKSQERSNKISNIFQKIGTAIGFLLAGLLALVPGCQTVAAVMIVGLVASLVIPKAADAIMKACNVPEDTRAWVTMGLTIAIGVINAIASFDPKGLVTAAGKAVATKVGAFTSFVASAASTATTSVSASATAATAAAVAAKVAKAASQVVDTIMDFLNNVLKLLKSIKSITTISDKLSKATQNIMDVMQPIMNKINSIGRFLGKVADGAVDFTKSAFDEFVKIIDELLSGSEKIISRLESFATAADLGTLTVQTGFSLKSSAIQKDLTISKAKQEAFEVRIGEIIKSLDEAMKAASRAFESLANINSSFSEFQKRNLQIHL